MAKCHSQEATGIVHRKVKRVFTFLEKPVSCRSDCENFTWNINTLARTFLSDSGLDFYDSEDRKKMRAVM